MLLLGFIIGIIKSFIFSVLLKTYVAFDHIILGLNTAYIPSVLCSII